MNKPLVFNYKRHKELKQAYKELLEDNNKLVEAIDMAIEALTEPINCVKCKHYYETEDDTDVHGHCRMDTAHTNPMNKGAWLIPIISLVALTVAVVGLLAQIWRIYQKT